MDHMMPEHADKLRRPQKYRTAETFVDVNKGSQDPSSRESIVRMVRSERPCFEPRQPDITRELQEVKDR
jgi:hypothetical protein